MRKSIVSRFFSATSMLIVTSISILGLLLMFFANKYFSTERTNTLNLCLINAEETVVENLSREGGINEAVSRNALRSSLRLIANSTSSVLFVADADGICIVCTENEKCVHTGTLISPLIMEMLSGSNKSVQLNEAFSDLYSGHFYTVGRSIKNKKGVVMGYVFASSDASSINLFTNALLSMFMMSAGFMLLVSSIVSIWVTSKLTTPLRNISEAAKKFSQGDFSARVMVEGDDEVARLAYTFNQMASFVEKNETSHSSFVANIAHELRTPMTSIKGFVDGILDGTIPPQQEKKYLTVVSDEIGRLARLTNSMLDISKLESGEFLMNVKKYNIWDTIAATAFAFENRIENANIEIRGFKPQKITVIADQDIIHQVVYNIFDNALKFTPNGGYIQFDVAEDKATSSVIVKIRNSGQGIPKETLPYIFDRFYKADTSRSVHTKGAGIGLFIAKTLVQRSGGDISVESEENEYTEFIFTLPSGNSEKNKK